ncbi:thioesterase family protein [Streptomyces sp. NPDC002133]|uniref:acyl-CoA thioesterase n=1 Tax=Streptomyces sp. NPDC002133 TaxID=3154409 RepID=UPI003330E695
MNELDPELPATQSGPFPLTEVLVTHRVEWHDTDASGHQHHSAVLRWVEAAEAELLRGRGLDWLFGRTPRVRHEVNYRARLWFGETVTTRLRVVTLGRTSLTYTFEVRGREGVAAEGNLVVAHAEPDAPSATPWPEQVRKALGEHLTTTAERTK